MSHIQRISRECPAKAALWQDVMCEANEVLLQLLSAKGGELPIMEFISDKCDLPTDET